MDKILLCHLYKYKFVVKYWFRIKLYLNKCRIDIFNNHYVYILLDDCMHNKTYRFYDEIVLLEVKH